MSKKIFIILLVSIFTQFPKSAAYAFQDARRYCVTPEKITEDNKRTWEYYDKQLNDEYVKTQKEITTGYINSKFDGNEAKILLEAAEVAWLKLRDKQAAFNSYMFVGLCGTEYKEFGNIMIKETYTGGRKYNLQQSIDVGIKKSFDSLPLARYKDESDFKMAEFSSENDLNAHYHELQSCIKKKKESAEGERLLRDAERAWIAYRDAHVKYVTFLAKNGPFASFVEQAMQNEFALWRSGELYNITLDFCL